MTATRNQVNAVSPGKWVSYYCLDVPITHEAPANTSNSGLGHRDRMASLRRQLRRSGRLLPERPDLLAFGGMCLLPAGPRLLVCAISHAAQLLGYKLTIRQVRIPRLLGVAIVRCVREQRQRHLRSLRLLERGHERVTGCVNFEHSDGSW